MINFLLALSVALWVVAIAIIAVQNATPIAVNFFTFQSIRIPFGVALAFGVAAGALGMTVVQILWRFTAPATERGRDEDPRLETEAFDSFYSPADPQRTYIQSPTQPSASVPQPKRDRKPKAQPPNPNDWADERSDDW